jgi:hypothetical protein
MSTPSAPRYAVMQARNGRVHLLDNLVPEPKRGGDPSGIVCDVFTSASPTFWVGEIATLDGSAGDFGRAFQGACPECWSIAWNELISK